MSALPNDTVTITTSGTGDTILGTTDKPADQPENISVVSKMQFDDTGKPIAGKVETPTTEAPKVETKSGPTPEELAAAHTKAAEDTKKILGDKGIDVKALSDEWAKNGGKLSDTTVAALEAAGFSREMQEAFIAGQQARQDKIVSSLHDLVGGKEAYDAAFAWAGKNLSQEEVAYIRDTYGKGDLGAIRMVVKSVHAQMVAANANAPRPAPVLPEGSPQVRSGVQPFASQAEQEEAFADPKYRTSQVYRDNVEKRMLATLTAQRRS